MRAPLRQEIGKVLQTKGAELFRTEEAVKKMKIEDLEPGNMPKASTLRVAKVEYKKSTYLDPDPIKAIQIMKLTTWETAIHTIFQDPFGCHLCTTHQSRLYLDYSRTEVAKISIDASDGKIKSFEVFDGESTGPIF